MRIAGSRDTVMVLPHLQGSSARSRSRASLRIDRAWAALLVLVACVLVAQPLSVPVANEGLKEVYGGVDAHTQWAYYISHPAPEVLFIGPSNARMDVDVPRLTRLLSERAGRYVSVDKLGVNAEQPAFLEALTYRVMQRASRPRLVIFSVAAAMFNPTFHCPACIHDDLLTLDLWQISSPFDAGFMRLATQLDPSWPALVAGWMVPAVAYHSPEGAAIQCPIVNHARELFLTNRWPLPGALLQPTACDLGVRPLPTGVMTDETRKISAQIYTQQFVSHYQFSPSLAANFQAMVRLARAGGATVLAMNLPEYGLAALAPAADRTFRAGMSRLYSSLALPNVDLSGAMTDQPGLWTDPLHLNTNGAAAFAPKLASAVAPRLAR